jgi:release factor glutamine methyltransferase
MTRINCGEWQAKARTALISTSENPGLEAQLLLAFALKKSRTWILAHPETEISPQQQGALSQLLLKLQGGMPLAYLTGKQEFFGLSFMVSPAVLIPRPETELLVEQGLAWLKSRERPIRAADIGTGSGCIAVTLAHHLPELRVDAVDISMAALHIAQANARLHHVSNRVGYLQADLLSALKTTYDLICANLPYIPSETVKNLPVARYEPLVALDGGIDGIIFIRRLLTQAQEFIKPGGAILLEIEYRQGKFISEIAQGVLPGCKIQIHKDLAGLDRLVEIQSSTS